VSECNTLTRPDYHSNNLIAVVPMQRSHSIGHGLTHQTSKSITNNNHTNYQHNGKSYEQNENVRLALSQPLLNKPFNDHYEHHRSALKISGSGTMYRPDILYQVSNIKRCKMHGFNVGC
jgi:hypothetical protein